MSHSTALRAATNADLPAIVALLEANRLPAAGLERQIAPLDKPALHRVRYACPTRRTP